MNFFKRILVIAAALFYGFTAIAQDIITTKDGRVMEVSILDVLGSSIYFRQAGAPANSEPSIIDMDDVAAVSISQDNPLLAAIFSWASAQTLDVDELVKTLYAEDYNKFNLKIAGGYTCMLTGGMIATVGLCLGGVSLLVKQDNPASARGLGYGAIGCAAGGLALMAVGIPMKNKGKTGQQELYERYRREYCSTLNVGTTANGFGLALRF